MQKTADTRVIIENPVAQLEQTELEPFFEGSILQTLQEYIDNSSLADESKRYKLKLKINPKALSNNASSNMLVVTAAESGAGGHMYSIGLDNNSKPVKFSGRTIISDQLERDNAENVSNMLRQAKQILDAELGDANLSSEVIGSIAMFIRQTLQDGILDEGPHALQQSSVKEVMDNLAALSKEPVQSRA